jgi:hypothetical protein
MSEALDILRRPVLRVLAAAGLAAAALLGSRPALSGEERVRVLIESPAPGVRVEDQVHQARISGTAIAEGDEPVYYDVMLAIDVSASTRASSGVDVDGDGVVGFDPPQGLLPPTAYSGETLSSDPEDSILYAEVAAARALIERLDTRRVRVGVLSFAGEVDPTTGERKHIDQQDAWVDAPLTADLAQIHRTLDALLARGARGATNFAAGVRLAVRELSGLAGARSGARPDAKKVILFLTDGAPTLPTGRGNQIDAGDSEAAVRAAEVAHRAGITINSYALGPGALTYPQVVTEMARVSLGTFTPVQNPGDIIMLLQGVSFANVEDVVFTNVTTGDFSTDVRLNPDGSFQGYVPVQEGSNRVRVVALASDGTRGAVEFELVFHRSELSSRDKLSELEEIQRQNKALELRRLELEIKTFREQQRKEITLTPEAEKEQPPTEAPAPGR